MDNIVNGYRRNRDLCIPGFLGAWGIQAIQAKFEHSFTMDTDFSMHITPTILNLQPAYALRAQKNL